MLSKHAKDPESIVIGSKTRWAARKPKPTTSSSGELRADDKVDLYIDGKFVETVSWTIGVRFSRTFAAAFARQPGSTPESNVSGPVTIEKAVGEGGLAKKSEHQLNLKMDSLPVQPDVESFQQAFSWMKTCQDLQAGEDLPPFAYLDHKEASIQTYVDWYAASLVLQMRPPAQVIKSEIMAKLSVFPPSFNELKCIHQHLPAGDVIITRGVTSYYEWQQKDVYDKDEIKDFDAYFRSLGGSLYERYHAIERSVKYKAKESAKSASAAE